MTKSGIQGFLSNSSCLCCHGLSLAETIGIGILSSRFDVSQQIAAFISLSGITDPVQISAVTTLAINASLHGWWDKCDLIYPFVGGNATAHSINLKSPGDYTITWNDTVIHNANGITGDGANGYANTGFVPSLHAVNYQVSDAHGYVYQRSAPTAVANKAYFSARPSSANALDLETHPTSATDLGIRQINGWFATSAVPIELGGMALSRTTEEGLKMFVFFPSSTTENTFTPSGTLPNAYLVLLGKNIGTYPGISVSSRADANLAAFTLGAGLNRAEFDLMNSDWQTFQTALGRQV